MLHKLIERRQRGSEEGFTLIELMVVVLIIAILIAIAIPTFLGARSRAQQRSAQSNIRNSFTAEKTAFTDNDQYDSTVANMQKIEPALNWVKDVAPTNTTKNTVSVSVWAVGSASANDTVVLGAKADDGTCYYLRNVGTGPTAVQYATDATCRATSTFTDGTTAPSVAWTDHW